MKTSEALRDGFRALRQRRFGTQERMGDATGERQSYISGVETGRIGYGAVDKVSAALERAGVSPVEWLLESVALLHPDEPEVRELLSLFGEAGQPVRGAVLTMLRAAVPRQRQDSEVA